MPPENDERRPPTGAAHETPAKTSDHSVAERCSRCSSLRSGLILPDGRQRCGLHATNDDVRLVDRLDAHAPEIGLRRSGEWAWGAAYVWPYGANVDVGMRARLLAWAVPIKLQLTDRPGHACPRWLTTGRACSGRRCTLGAAWHDHVTTWKRAGRPAVLVAQPYKLARADVRHLEQLDATGLRVTLHAEGSWYGNGTWLITIELPAEVSA